MKHIYIFAGMISLVFGLTIGCGKPASNAPNNPPAGGMATQGSSAEASSTYADAKLADLTRELRRWIVATKERPANFEAFAAKSKVTVPPPPEGKKYALSSEMRVILVNR